MQFLENMCNIEYDFFLLLSVKCMLLQLGCCTGQSFPRHTYVNKIRKPRVPRKLNHHHQYHPHHWNFVLYSICSCPCPVVVCSAQVEAKTCQVVQQTAERNRFATIVFGGTPCPHRSVWD
uniref:(northern house mosquito) hypothetical protein n=1 Tax=Culex pipiens TaxID=7175 RepID=A0A8D8F0H7_CULPI